MKKICSLIVILSMVSSFSLPAFATSSTWINTGIDSATWTNTDDWLSGNVPGATTGTTNIDVATFNSPITNGFGNSTAPVTTVSGLNIGGISFDTAAGNYYIGTTTGYPLLLTSGGITQVLNTLTSLNAIETINAPLVIEGAAGTYAFLNNSANGSGAGAGTLDIGGGITGGAAGATVLTLSGINTNSNTISGIIANGSATSLAVTKSGAGTWVLSGANTYTGATAVNDGILNIQNNNAMGTGSATVASGGTLQLQGGINVSNALTLTGAGSSGSNGALESVSGNNTYAGLVTLGGDAQINADAGTLTLSNTGTITGAADDLTIGGEGNVVINSIIGTAGGNLIMEGAGTLTLTGDNTFTGNTTVSSGILNIQNANALGTGAGSATVASGATLQIENGITTAAEALTLNGSGADNNGALENVSGNNTYAGLVTLGSDTRINSDAGTLTLSNAGTISGSGYKLTVGGIGNTTINSIIGTGDGDLTKDGAGILTLAGANTYTGVTTLDAGIINLGVAEIVGTSGPLGASAASNPGSIVLNGGYLQYSTLNQNDYSGRFSTAIDQQYNVDTNAQSVTWGTALTSSGGSLTKTGSGTLTLTGANTYTGGTTVNGGTLTVGAGGTLGATTGTLAVNNPNTGAGTAVVLNLSTSAPTTTGSLSGTIATPSSGTNTATIDNGGQVFTVDQTVDGTYAGVIADTGAFSLGASSTAALTLTGANTYSGGTSVNGGILNIQNNNALGTAAAAVASGATLQLEGGITVSNALTLNGTGYSSSEGALENVSGANTYSGLITLGSDALISSDAGGLTISNAGTITGSGINLTVGGSGNTTINSIIGTGTGKLTMNGTGTLTLTGANTYTGVTTLNEGIINLGVAEDPGVSGPLGASTALGSIVLNGGYLQYSSLNNYDYSSRFSTAASQWYNVDTNGQSVTWATPLTSTGGILIKDGAGTLTLTGANTYTDATFVNGGTLTVGAGGTLGSSSATLNVSNENTGAGTAVVLNLSTSSPTTTGTLGGSLANPSSGTNTATINNGGQLFTVNQSSDETYAGVIAGAGGFDLESANSSILTFSGLNTYSGGTTINGGTLQISGSGTLGSGFVTNNATLDIGANNLVLSGAYTQSSGSTLNLTATTATNYGYITAPSASVVDDSKIHVTVGYIQNGASPLEIINAGGDLTGTAPATVTSSSSAITFTSSISGGNLYLDPTNTLASFANNANAHSVATVLANVSAPSSDMSSVLTTLYALTPAQIASALNTMGPIVDGGVTQNSSAALNNFIGASLDRVQNVLSRDSLVNDSLNNVETSLAHPEAENFNTTGISSGDESEINGLWAKPYGSYLNQGKLQGIEGYNAWNAGTIVGYDRMIADNLTVGMSGGYAYGAVNSDVNNAITDITSGQGTIYAGYQGQEHPYFIDAAGTFAWNWYKGKRDISVGTLDRTADADYDGQQYSTYLGGGYKFNIWDNLMFTPLASLQWTHLTIGSYTEANAGSLDLNVHSQNYDTLESGLGAGISSETIYNWGIITPEVHAKWIHDLVNDDMSVTSSFVGGGGAFTVNGASPSKDGADIGGKLSFDFINDVSFIAQCDMELREGFIGIYGSGTIHYKF